MRMLRPLLILISILPIFCFAQVKTTGIPNIRNYPKSIYKAGTQNWGINQDQNGFMYFANNDGLLCYDGVIWNLIQISESSAVRSVFVDSKNNIYVGLANDFGIVTREKHKRPHFKSLKNLLPENFSEFDDIWKIHEIPEGIVFQCFNYIFLYNNEQIKVIQPQNSFYFSFQINNKLYAQEPGIGLFEFANGELIQLPVSSKLIDTNISTILKLNENKILIGTEANGLFVFQNKKVEKWNTPANDFIEKNKLYCATTIPGNYFVFGTILNGIVIADSDGNIIQKLNTANGIKNNTILSSFADKDGNLWLGLDNGIDYVEINSPISFIGNSASLGTGYCCRIVNENLYIGTNQGLFVRPFNTVHNNQAFELVKNTAGQVWFLEEFAGQLICGHNSGTFVIEGNEATQISKEEGTWKYIRLKNNPNYILGGHYNGLVLLRKEKNGWIFQQKISGFDVSSRYLFEDDDNNIWVGHGGKGIYKITLSEKLDSAQTVKFYTAENGLASTFGNILFKLKNKIYVAGTTGIYEYDKTPDMFKLSEEDKHLSNIKGQIKSITPDSEGNIWFITTKESGVLKLNIDLSYTKIISPFNKLNDKYVSEFEFIYPFNDENIFFGIDNGFAHYSTKYAKSYSEPFQTYITKLELPYFDSILFINAPVDTMKFEFPFKKNTFRFHFAAPFYENNLPVLFSYYLEGFSDNWSMWSTDSYKDFMTLYEGIYVFHVKAKNIYGVESEVATLRFVISPPWHRSKIAYYIYLLVFIIVTFAFVKFILYRFKIAKQKEKMKNLQEFERKKEQYRTQEALSEKEIVKLRNDKLRAEKQFRDKELANQTMGIIQKNRFLVKLNEELRLLQNSIEDDSVRTKITILKRRIKKETENDQQSKIFETYFDEVHKEFFNRLKEKYPNLSPNDLRLCAYIKMNISTKEISTLLNISYRGVEISRYRLRKKLGLSREINLSTFLLNI